MLRYESNESLLKRYEYPSYMLELRHLRSLIALAETGQRLVALARSVMGEVQTAERDLAKLAKSPARSLRIALECHTCFDWLMPIMDVFRKEWPEVELDLVSGFHP